MNIPLDHTQSEGAHTLRCTLPTGLYCMTANVDGRAFDWESLYLNLNSCGNVDERTGPWDFHLTDNFRPLLPAYWVFLDGRKLGLWYINRPSVDQIEQRCFYGELGFRVEQDGEHELRFEPFHRFNVEWASVFVQPEQYDKWEPPARLAHDPAESLRLPDTMPANRFTQAYLHSVRFAKGDFDFDRWGVGGFQLPILLSAWHWSKDATALEIARQSVERYLTLPAWGNPKEDGYSHNGDMGAAKLLFGLAIALRWLPDELFHLRDRIVQKLKYQGDVFLEQALLHRGYWGGAIQQDHGFQSFTWFATAAYLCWGVIESANDWLAFALPRMRRSIDALPMDGVVPCTCYHVLATYVDKLVLYRELHRSATGQDIYEHPALASIPCAARAMCVPEPAAENFPLSSHDTGLRLAHPSPLGDLWPFEGAVGFLAQQTGNADAAELVDIILSSRRLLEPRYPFWEGHLHKNWLWALLFCDKPRHSSTPVPHNDIRTARETNWFKDSGVVATRSGGSLVVIKCGAPTSINAYKKTTNGHDRMCFAPLAGNFVYVHGSRKVLHSTDSRYRIYTAHGNVMLVDNKGQQGDAGMPMSQPDAPYHGERILQAEHGRVEMDLSPTYTLLTRYTRRLELDDRGALVLTDSVSAETPRRLSWLFHTYQRNPWHRVGPATWELHVDGEVYQVDCDLQDAAFETEIRTTHAVWSYPDNAREQCHHLVIRTIDPVAQAILSFRLTPGRNT